MSVGLPTHARATSGECPYCGGTLFQLDYSRVCNDCGFEQDPTGREGVETPDAWTQFWNERAEYQSGAKSGRPRCPGGFPSAYHGPGLYGEG